jgi:hypothetical protein
MTISLTITRTKLALAVLVAAMMVPATALATQAFEDVPDGKFYAEPVAWALEHEITTGKAAGYFAPDDAVTRGETVTFLKRYHDNVVEPTVDDLRTEIDDLSDVLTTVDEELAAHAAHTTSHFVIVEPGGDLHRSTYPGASAVKFATGVYHIDLPGLEIHDWDEELRLCDLQANPLSDAILIAGAILSDDAPVDEFQVVAWVAQPDGSLVDGAVSVQITC